MTLDEILDRWNTSNPTERNLWVVETVLGWRWWRTDSIPPMRVFRPPGWSPKDYYDSPEMVARITTVEGPDYGGLTPTVGSVVDVLKVTTNRGEVWRVVDAMREKGYLFRLFQQEREWHAYFKKPGYFTIWPAEQVHVCEAICLSALIALEKDKP